MSILHRFGSADDFDPNKMRARELAYVNTTNSTYKAGLYLCYAPGDVRRLTTEQDIINILNTTPTAYTALQQLLTDLGSNPNELTNILSNISILQSSKLDKTGDSKDNVTTYTEASTDTDIASGDTHATLFGKILKRFNSIKTALESKFDKANIANNLITTAAGLVLDARQGKALMDLINTINNNLAVIPLTPAFDTNYFNVVGYSDFYRIGHEVHISCWLSVTELVTIREEPYTIFANIPIPINTKYFTGYFVDGNGRYLSEASLNINSNGQLFILVASTNTIRGNLVIDVTYRTA